jgi:hypothetical protein
MHLPAKPAHCSTTGITGVGLSSEDRLPHCDEEKMRNQEYASLSKRHADVNHFELLLAT